MALPIQKKGGVARYVIENVATGQSIVLPKGFMIEDVITKKIGTTAGNFLLGDTNGGGQVVATIALGVVDGVIAKQTVIAPYTAPKSFTADTTLYVTVSAGACDLYINMKKIG